MKTIEYRTIDKRKWGHGPWQEEPDKVQWKDEVTGLPCLAVRNPRCGHWCGYVGVAEGHPYFGKSYFDCDVEVHGGLSFAAFCRPEENLEGSVCHVPEPGEPDHVWWLGFDCAHAFDTLPAFPGVAVPGSSYKSLDYVKDQCARLAQQLEVLK